MRKVLGVLTLLVIVSVGLFLLYASSSQLLKPIPVAPLGLVSTPSSVPVGPQRLTQVPATLADVAPDGRRRLITVGKDRTRLKIPDQYLVPGKCFWVTAIDWNGNESAPSNVICLEPAP